MSTRAYVDLMFAWGHARLGEADTVRQLVAEAAQRLHPSPDPTNPFPQVDAVHAWLLDAFTFRIEEAIAGRPHGGPWPAESIRRLEGMDEPNRTNQASRRYVVDRLRQLSRILEPAAEVDPYSQWKIHVRYGAAIRHLVTAPRDQWPNRVREFCDRIDQEADILDRLEAYRALLGSDEITGSECGTETADRGRTVAIWSLERRWADHPDVPALFARHRVPPPQSDKDAWAEYQADVANPGAWVERNVFSDADWLHYTTLRLAGRRGWRQLVASHTDDLVRMSAGNSPGARCLYLTPDLPTILVRLGMRPEAQRLSDERRDVQLAAYRASADAYQLVVCLAIAASDLWLGRPERANEVLDLACYDIGRFDKPGFVAGVIRRYLEAILHLPWPDRRGRVDGMLAVMPHLPNGFTTAEWYSKLHVEIIDRVVRAIVLPKFDDSGEQGVFNPGELAVRREALRDLRGRLVEWGQPDWGPRPSKSNSAGPGHAAAS
jgi:cellulose synthase operon protein C